MNLPPPLNKQWEKIASDHAALVFHIERYPYLGVIPSQGGHYYAFHDQGIQGVVMVFQPDNDPIWQVGCSFNPDYRGRDAKKACEDWLTAYKLTYTPLQVRCLLENKPAQYLAAHLGFERQAVEGGWAVYHHPH